MLYDDLLLSATSVALLRRRSSLLALRYSYSIGSSALSRIDVGTSRPSALAVVILSTVLYFTECEGLFQSYFARSSAAISLAKA